MPEDNKEKKEGKNIIEIPQEYYDKIEEEKRLKEEQEEQKILEEQRDAQGRVESGKLLSSSVLNGIVTFCALFAMLNISVYFLVALGIYYVVGSIVSVSKHGEKSDFPTSVLVGSIFGAIVTFILSFVFSDKVSLYTYYAIACTVCGVIGIITSGIVTWICNDFKNIKALSMIGIFLYFAGLIGIPYYFYNKYPEEFYKIVFHQKTEVVAETEIEFTEKTLKNRYGVAFTCNKGKRTNNVNHYVTMKRTCTDASGNEVNVLSTAYNETDVLYVVQDNYLKVLFLDKYISSLEEEISAITSGKASVAIYPKKGCSFVGDCHDCEEYTDSYKEENDLSNQYKFSSQLDLQKYLGMDGLSFVNAYEFKYIIDLSGHFGGMADDMYENIITNILDKLNALGLKNKFGYEIIIKNSQQYNKVLYKVIGKSSSSGSFENPEIVEK